MSLALTEKETVKVLRERLREKCEISSSSFEAGCNFVDLKSYLSVRRGELETQLGAVTQMLCDLEVLIAKKDLMEKETQLPSYVGSSSPDGGM